MRVILNPEIGAPIEDIQFEGTNYFKDKPWGKGEIKKFEDDGVADYLLGVYGFLVPFTLEEAKQYAEDQKKKSFKCEKCDFTTDEQVKLNKHLEKHAKEAALEKELGLETVESKGSKKTKKELQDAINSQAKDEGLYGEGLVDERRPIAKRF